MNHTQTGDITEMKFVVYCMEHNIPICKPLGNNLPYDFIIEVKKQLYRVQVKTGYGDNIKDGFMFNTRSTSKNYNEITTKDYVDKIEGFVVWYEQIPEHFFYIPIDKAASGTMKMYYGDDPKSNQNYVGDFDIDALFV